MPRGPRNAPGGLVYHVLNRSNGRRRLFRRDEDYAAFLRVLAEALRRHPLELFAFCVMPNHWHLVVRPAEDGHLSRFMRWLAQTHTQRWRHAKKKVGEGALYQGRFKSFIVQEDHHFLAVCRYVEGNAVRPTLARRARAWRWGSAGVRAGKDDALKSLLSQWPVRRPANWSTLLDEPQPEQDRAKVAASIERNRPLGDERWTTRTAARLGQEHTLRNPGRPRKPAASGEQT